MSAADPARPTPPTPVNPADGAAVIDISRRASAHTTRGRWTPVSPGPDPHAGPPPEDTLRLNADHFEKTFNEQHLTLSDDDTAAAYRTTLGIVRGIIAAAHDQGLCADAQYQHLDALLKGMLTAPDLV